MAPRKAASHSSGRPSGTAVDAGAKAPAEVATDGCCARGPLPVYFLVLSGTLLLDLAGIAEAFRVANQLSGKALFQARFIGPEENIASSVGLQLARIDPLPRAIEPDAWLVICGMSTPEEAIKDASVVAAAGWLRQVVTEENTVCCVCAGALIAAAAGLLDGRQCTSHHTHTAWLQTEYPRTRVLENRIFVRDGNVYTSAGVTSGVDLALVLISEVAGPVTAAQVARDLVVYIRRTATDPQLSVWLNHRNHLHSVVHRAQDAVVSDPARAWTLKEIANSASVSVRTLSRLFRDEAGVTPLQYVEQIRLAVARERQATTRWSMERIAASAGFSSALQLRRAARRNGATTRGLLPREVEIR